VRASPVKFSGFNSPTARFVYPAPSNYPDINPDVGPNASLAAAVQVLSHARTLKKRKCGHPHGLPNPNNAGKPSAFLLACTFFFAIVTVVTLVCSGIKVQLLLSAIKRAALGLFKATGSAQANNPGV
jgi:hypothetical protein